MNELESSINELKRALFTNRLVCLQLYNQLYSPANLPSCDLILKLPNTDSLTHEVCPNRKRTWGIAQCYNRRYCRDHTYLSPTSMEHDDDIDRLYIHQSQITHHQYVIPSQSHSKNTVVIEKVSVIVVHMRFLHVKRQASMKYANSLDNHRNVINSTCSNVNIKSNKQRAEEAGLSKPQPSYNRIIFELSRFGTPDGNSVFTSVPEIP